MRKIIEDRFSVPNRHNPNGPRQITIEGLAALAETEVSVQKGDKVIYDEYGRPINVTLVEDKAINYTATMQLRATYHNPDASQEDRKKAGIGLKYPDFWINAHEYLISTRKTCKKMKDAVSHYFADLVFGKEKPIVPKD